MTVIHISWDENALTLCQCFCHAEVGGVKSKLSLKNHRPYPCSFRRLHVTAASALICVRTASASSIHPSPPSILEHRKTRRLSGNGIPISGYHAGSADPTHSTNPHKSSVCTQTQSRGQAQGLVGQVSVDLAKHQRQEAV